MATSAQPAGRKRLVHQLDSPFSTTTWPRISSDDQDTILELLCSLLSPLGQHRQAHIRPSKGKRAAKRDKKATAQGTPSPLVANIPTPAEPELSASIDIGFNSITRTLEALSGASQEPSSSNAEDSSKFYSMVFVARGDQSSAFNCHFPQMVGIASSNLPSDEAIRLVGFSKPCSERISRTLGLARVSSIAITRKAPGAAALRAFVQKNVPAIDLRWPAGERGIEYLTTQLNSVETPVGPKRVKQI